MLTTTSNETENKSVTIDHSVSQTSSDVEKAGEEAANIISQRTKPFVAIVACAAALGGLIFGYDIVSCELNSSNT